jgi:hypothetical protein
LRISAARGALGVDRGLQCFAGWLIHRPQQVGVGRWDPAGRGVVEGRVEDKAVRDMPVDTGG